MHVMIASGVSSIVKMKCLQKIIIMKERPPDRRQRNRTRRCLQSWKSERCDEFRGRIPLDWPTEVHTSWKSRAERLMGENWESIFSNINNRLMSQRKEAGRNRLDQCKARAKFTHSTMVVHLIWATFANHELGLWSGGRQIRSCVSKWGHGAVLRRKVQIWKLTHEIVIPRALARNHVEAEETIGKQHLDFFIVRWKVALRIVATICILAAPLKATGSQFVCGE